MPPARDTPPLLAAVQVGDVAAIQRMRSEGADMLVRAPRTDNTALHLAAAEGRLDVLRALLPSFTSGSVDSRNANDDTPLMFACAKARIAVAALLLDAGASVSRVNRGRTAALAFAAASGSRHVVELLLRSSPPPDAAASDEHGRTAMHYAAENDAAECVEALLRAGADPFARDARGRTPMDAAAAEGAAAAKAALEREAERRTAESEKARLELLEAEGVTDDHRGREAGSKASGTKNAKKSKTKKKKAASPTPPSQNAESAASDGESAPSLAVNPMWGSFFAQASGSSGGGKTVEPTESKEQVARDSGGDGTPRRVDEDADAKTNSAATRPAGADAAPEPPGPSPPTREKARALESRFPPGFSARDTLRPMNSTNRRGPPVSFAEAAAGRGKSAAASASAALEEAPRRVAPPRPTPPAPDIWVAEANARLERVHPTAVALDVAPRHLLGVGLDELSYSQLEAAEEVHRELLSRLADARVELVRQQERTRAEELAEIERLRAALADATAK